MAPALPDPLPKLAARAGRMARLLPGVGRVADALLGAPRPGPEPPPRRRRRLPRRAAARARDEERLARLLVTTAGQRATFAMVARRLRPVAREGVAGAIVIVVLAPPRAPASWTIALDGVSARARRGAARAPQLTARVTAANLAALLAGRVEPAEAMLDGRLEIRGDYALLMRLARSVRSQRAQAPRPDRR